MVKRLDFASNLFVSSGVADKPQGCSECPYRKTGIGFVPDEVNPGAKCGFMLEAPGGDEVLEQRPVVGRAGKLWEWRFVKNFGYKRSDVAIFNSIRCRPPGNKYPTGKLRKSAESACRFYDGYNRGDDGDIVPGGLRGFAPDVYVVTYHPAAALRTRALSRLIETDVGRAWDLVEKGYRPLVVMGDKALNIIMPGLKGGMKSWRGHYTEERRAA